MYSGPGYEVIRPENSKSFWWCKNCRGIWSSDPKNWIVVESYFDSPTQSSPDHEQVIKKIPSNRCPSCFSKDIEPPIKIRR